MSGVERLLRFGVEGIVGAVALINPAALVDAAGSLSQTVDDIVLFHAESKDKAVVFNAVIVGKRRKIRGARLG